MSKISPINSIHSIPVPARMAVAPRPRRAAIDALDGTHLCLVPRVARQAPAPAALARCRLFLQDHPYVVDVGFVGLTVGMATLFWRWGW